MKRALATVAAVLVVCGFAWLAGFDFNERGSSAFFVTYCALAAAVLTYFCPNWSK